VLVEFMSALGSASDAHLQAFRTEPELRQVFLETNLVPDGWIAWNTAAKHFNCFIEVDLHHEGLTFWREKVLKYVAYAQSSLHQELFGYRFFRVLVVAKSHARIARLRQVSAHAGRMFVFAELVEVRAQTIFSSIWLTSTGEDRTALGDA
jgi:hypothetical protein